MAETFWHYRKAPLAVGQMILPGRWGQTVLAIGKAHTHFFRELLLELYRVRHTSVAVSRLNCAFAFEDRSEAQKIVDETGTGCVLEVEGADDSEAGVRLDMLWITWFGEPAYRTFERNVEACESYWSGRSTQDANPAAEPAWEWLFAGGLRVVAQEHVARPLPARHNPAWGAGSQAAACPSTRCAQC